MEYFYLEHVKSKNVMCQIRTDERQPFMFFNGCYIIKGTYNEHNFNNVIERSKMLQIFKAPNIIHPINHFVTPHGVFLRFDNFLANYQMETELYREPFSRDTCEVVKNLPIVTMKKILNADSNTWIFSHVRDLILTLCYCYILNIPGMNIDNIYVNIDTKQIYIIDYACSPITDIERDDEVFYFNEKPNESHYWLNNCKHYYNDIADNIDKLLNDKIVTLDFLRERMLKTVTLLRNFGIKSKIIIPKIFTKLQICSPYENDPNSIYFYTDNKYIRLTNYLQKNGYLFENSDGRFMSVQHAYQYYKFNYINANSDTLKYSDIILNNMKFYEFIGKQKEIDEILLHFDVFSNKILVNNSKAQKDPYLKDNLRIPKTSYPKNNLSDLASLIKDVKPDSDKKEKVVIPKMINSIYSRPLRPPFQNKNSEILETQKNVLNYDDKGNLLIDKYEDYYKGYNLNSNRMNEKAKLNNKRNKLNTIIRDYKSKAKINPKWNNIKVNVMRYILYKKFNENEFDRNILLSTEDKILYADKITHNTFWGIDDKGNGDNNLGKLLMELRILFKEKYLSVNINNNVILDNINPQILKLNLRKYIQRSITNKSLLLASILYDLKLDADNIYNFLYDVAINDIGPANRFLTLIIIKVCDEKLLEKENFLDIIRLLSESDKSRLSCHAWYAYFNYDGRQISAVNGLDMNIKLNKEDVTFINRELNCDLFNKLDLFDVRHLLLKFWVGLSKKNLNSFSYCYLYMEATKESQNNSITSVWKILSKFINCETVNILKNAYYNSKENFIFLQQAITMVIYRDKPVKKYETNIKYFKVEGEFKLDNNIDQNVILIPENMIYYDELLHKIYDQGHKSR